MQFKVYTIVSNSKFDVIVQIIF